MTETPPAPTAAPQEHSEHLKESQRISKNLQESLKNRQDRFTAPLRCGGGFERGGEVGGGRGWNLRILQESLENLSGETIDERVDGRLRGAQRQVKGKRKTEVAGAKVEVNAEVDTSTAAGGFFQLRWRSAFRWHSALFTHVLHFLPFFASSSSFSSPPSPPIPLDSMSVSASVPSVPSNFHLIRL